MPRPRDLALALAVLAALVAGVYLQTAEHAFITLDDQGYIAENPEVLRGITPEGVSWAFTTFRMGNWHPLTWLSHMADVELFGPRPGPHHLVNALLHLANTWLLFLLLRRMTGDVWPAALAAALFGVHPLHVESVAWLSERKDVLSTGFWLLATWAYVRYVARPGPARYAAVASLFALSLMCKPMPVSFPLVLLVLDWWPLGRMAPSPAGWRKRAAELARLSVEKIPLFAMALASCAITLIAQADGKAIVPVREILFSERVSNAVVSYLSYARLTVWPSGLAPVYPHRAALPGGIPPWETGLAAAALVAASVAAVRLRTRRPWILAGWIWYLVTLLPVIGLVQVGVQSMADRYTYVPLIGLFVAASWSVPLASPGSRRPRLLPAACAAAAILSLAAAARVQAAYWRDSVTLFSRTLAVTERNFLAATSLGEAYAGAGDPKRSIALFREALSMNPEHVTAWNALGVAYGRQGRIEEALAAFAEALRIEPSFVEARYNLGLAYSRSERFREAAVEYRKVIAARPDHSDAWNNLGVALEGMGMTREAIAGYAGSVRARPGNAMAWRNLGAAYGKIGLAAEAAGCLRRAAALETDAAGLR